MLLYARHTSPAGKVTYRAWGADHHGDAYPMGHHLVSVSDHGRVTVFEIEPAHASLLAAAREAEADTLAAITEAMEPTPTAPLTPAQARALRGVVLHRRSPVGVFERFVGAVVARMKP